VNGKEEFSKLKTTVNTFKSQLLSSIETIQTKSLKSQLNTKICSQLQTLEKKLSSLTLDSNKKIQPIIPSPYTTLINFM